MAPRKGNREAMGQLLRSLPKEDREWIRRQGAKTLGQTVALLKGHWVGGGALRGTGHPGS